MKSKLSKVNSTEWLGIGFFLEGLIYIISWFIPSVIKESISAQFFSNIFGFIGLLLFSASLIFLVGYLVGHHRSKKI